MLGATELTDKVVREAAEGSRPDLDRLAKAMEPQVRLMVAARLSPTPAQYHAAEDVIQQVMVALTKGIGRIERRTVGGLRAYVSGIVRRKVSDLLKRRGESPQIGPAARSLNSTVAGVTSAGPLYQFLTAGSTSPRTMAERAEQVGRLMEELGKLKPEYREVITLAFFDQLPTGEIARQIDSSRAATSMLLVRAIRTLRRSVGVTE